MNRQSGRTPQRTSTTPPRPRQMSKGRVCSDVRGLDHTKDSLAAQSSLYEALNATGGQAGSLPCCGEATSDWALRFPFRKGFGILSRKTFSRGVGEYMAR
jgi:hypothetical protein